MKQILIFFILVLLFSCKTIEEIQPIIESNYEPTSNGEIIKHTYYSLAYSEENEQAFWVYYELTPELINGTQSRTNDFRTDPLVSTESASLDDYKSSGYDRGHLCPAGDMTLNRTSMSESFYLSNMSPQVAGFNRGIWRSLETQVREWALEFSKLYVVTGPIFEDNIDTIGINNVTVPGYYYKVLYDGNNKMIGLILPNASSSNSLNQFVVSVDQIEQKTGIDFFSGLNDDLENQLEGSVNTTGWDFN